MDKGSYMLIKKNVIYFFIMISAPLYSMENASDETMRRLDSIKRKATEVKQLRADKASAEHELEKCKNQLYRLQILSGVTTAATLGFLAKEIIGRYQR